MKNLCETRISGTRFWSSRPRPRLTLNRSEFQSRHRDRDHKNIETKQRCRYYKGWDPNIWFKTDILRLVETETHRDWEMWQMPRPRLRWVLLISAWYKAEEYSNINPPEITRNAWSTPWTLETLCMQLPGVPQKGRFCLYSPRRLIFLLAWLVWRIKSESNLCRRLWKMLFLSWKEISRASFMVLDFSERY